MKNHKLALFVLALVFSASASAIDLKLVGALDLSSNSTGTDSSAGSGTASTIAWSAMTTKASFGGGALLGLSLGPLGIEAGALYMPQKLGVPFGSDITFNGFQF